MHNPEVEEGVQPLTQTKANWNREAIFRRTVHLSNLRKVGEKSTRKWNRVEVECMDKRVAKGTHVS